jgi:CDP-paratose synthetase
MKILVTGVTGFIGRHLLPKLAMNETIELMTVNRTLQKANDLLQINQCTHILVDELDKIKNFEPEIVFHLASMVTSRNDRDVLDEILASNILFGVKLLDILKECSAVKLFVNTGSFAEYRLGVDKVDNAYLYTAAKTAFRQFVDYYSNLCGYKYIHIVPYTIYGGKDSQKKIIDYIIDSFSAETPVKMTKGEQILDFIHIDDVISFFVYIVNELNKFLELPNGETLYLGTGKGTSIRKLAELLEQKYHQKANIEWGGLPYRNRDVMYAVAPIEKLIELGWYPKISIEEGLLKMIRYSY